MLVLTCAVPLCVPGCGGTTEKSFIPDQMLAEDCLKAALEAWKAGKKHGEVESANPVIQVVDSKWRSGAKLQGYEILEELPSDGPKKFRVRLTLEKPPAPEETNYLVVVKDPMWVYLEKDYLTASTSM